MYPLFYIITLTDYDPNKYALPKKRFSLKRILFKALDSKAGVKTMRMSELSVNMDDLNEGTSKPKNIKCCPLCYCMFKLCYQRRNKVLTFQTPHTKAVIRYLSIKRIENWTFDDFKKLINMYLNNAEEASTAEFLHSKMRLLTPDPKSRSKRAVSSRITSHKRSLISHSDNQQGKSIQNEDILSNKQRSAKKTRRHMRRQIEIPDFNDSVSKISLPFNTMTDKSEHTLEELGEFHILHCYTLKCFIIE